MLLMLITMILILVAIFNSTNKAQAYGSALFLAAIVIVSLFITQLIFIVLSGAAVNNELVTQW
jgi:hypothetical protein